MSEFSAELLAIAERLEKLAGGAVEGGGGAPDGMIEVRPTGVLGQGKVRYWPEPIEVPRIDGTRGIELCWSYGLRMTYVKRPDGETYVPAIYRNELGPWFQGGGYGPERWRMYPVAIDRWIYPEDWMTQAEIDLRVQSDQQWAEDYHRKYGV